MDNSEKEWSGKSRGGGFGYRFFIGLIRYCGITSAYVFLTLVVAYFIPFAPGATAAIWSYYRKRLGYCRLRACGALYMHYYRFGQVLIDKMALRAGLQDRYRFTFDNYERFLEIINGDSGVVLIGAHVGCWEAGSAFFGKYARKINIVMFDGEDENVKKAMQRESGEEGYKIIPVNRGSIEAMLQIKVALNNGEYVCFNGDRFVHRENLQDVTFLGGKASFPKGPFLIARKCRVPVVFYYAMREKGRRYRFIFKEADTAGSRDVAPLIDQYADSLESVVRRYPRQWFNFYRFWEDESGKVSE